MNGLGTRSEKLFEVMEGMSKSDLQNLYNEYGVRTLYAKFGINIPMFKGDLVESLDFELTGFGEGDNLTKMKAIWSVTGLWV